AGDAASYSAVVTNGYGAATSAVVTLTVLSSNAPAITTQPQDAIGYVGQGVSFTVSAAGAGLRYQWFFQNAPINSATNNTYDLLSVSTNDAGGYFVVVTNTSCSVTSDVATLTILA